MILKKSYVYIFFFLLVFMNSCSSKKVIISAFPLNNIESSELIKNISKSELKYNNLRHRLKVEYNNGKSLQTVMVDLRASDKEIIWMSASMIVPIAKILITDNNLVFYERFQKTYINQELNEIKDLIGIQSPVQLFQNLFYGEPLLDITKGEWKRIDNPNFYVLQSTERIQNTIFINPENFQLTQQRIYLPIISSLVTISYSNFKKFEEKSIPTNVNISSMRGSEIISINLEFSQFDFPENITFPMEIPENYNSKSINDIIQ